MEETVVSLLMVAFALGFQCCLGHVEEPDSCSPSQSLPSPAHKYKKGIPPPLPPSLLLFRHTRFEFFLSLVWYFAAPNTLWQRYLNNIDTELKEYLPCPKDNFTACYKELIDANLSIFQDGITQDMLDSARVL